MTAHLVGGGEDRGRVHRGGEQQPVVVPRVREVGVEHRHPARHVADADRAAHRQGGGEDQRASRRVVGRGQHQRCRRPVGHHRDDRGHGQGTVDVREPHARRVVGHARLEPHRGGQPGRVDDQQHQVATAGMERLRGQVHLLGRGQVDEPDVGERGRPHRPRGERGPPVRRLDQVDEDPAHGAGTSAGSGSMPRADSACSICSQTVRTTATRAQRLSSPAITCQRPAGWSVRSSMSSTARR